MYQHLLVPIDDTDLAIALVGQAVDLSRRLGARLTFLHVLPSQGRPAGPHRSRELLAKAEAAARALGVPCDSLSHTADDLATAITEVAARQGCDLVVLASPGPHATAAAAAQTDAQSVLMRSGRPVLVAAVGSLPPPAHAIAVLRDEHRSLAAVLHAWRDLLAAAAEQAQPPLDLPSMRLTMQFLRGFSRVQHHPKESDLLFRLLRLRTATLDAELDELERQDARDLQMLMDLSDAVERLAGGQDGESAASLHARVEHYCDFVWDHLGREEGVVLPAAQRWLQAEDWAFLDMAYRSSQAAPSEHPSADRVLGVLHGEQARSD